MEQSRRRALLGVSIGHGAHDTWYGVAPILMAAMSAELGLCNADIALALLFYQGISSLTQPFFGRLSERIGGRPLAMASILWTTTCFSVLLFADSKLLLMALIAASGLGSGAWHPQGATNAAIAGGKRWGATASAIFFLGGTMGAALLGAAGGSFLLDRYGRPALLLISVITVILALTFVRTMVPLRLATSTKREDASSDQAGLPCRQADVNGHMFWVLIGVLLLGTAARRVAAESLQTFFPKYQNDLGVATVTYGALMSLFMIATAVGGVLGSYLSDRVGLRRVLTGSIALAALALWAFAQTQGIWGYVFFILTGLVLSPSHTLFMVACQRQFPHRMATMTGFFLGFAFVTGAVGAWLVGLAADTVGLLTMFRYLPWFLLLAAALAYLGLARPKAQVEVEEALA